MKSRQISRILFCAVMMVALLLVASACTPHLSPSEIPTGGGSAVSGCSVSITNGLIHVTNSTVAKGTALNLTAEDLPNKIFLGWSYEGEIVTTDKNYSFTVQEDAAINAIYCDAYRIYLDTDDVDIGVKMLTVGAGQNYALPIPTKDHATFDGWSDGAVLFTDGSGRSKKGYHLDRDVVLYARFTATPVYTVTVNDGTGETSEDYYEGETVTVTATDQTDKQFDGWFAVINSAETRLTDAYIYTFTVSGNISVYAKYHIAYSVVVIGGSGGGYYGLNEECTVVAEVPAGKTFVRWQVIGSGTTLSTDASYTFPVTASVNLEAVYE